MQTYTDLYASQAEPWDYSRRAAEILRHQTIAEEIKKVGRNFDQALDIGCGMGQLTHRLKPFTKSLSACDVSLPALQKAQAISKNRDIQFISAGLPRTPFQKEQFDLIILADGIHEFVQQKARPEALEEIHQVLKPNGIALFSDYMRPGKFKPFIELVEGRFRILKLIYLNDRLWYQFESWFKAVRHWKVVRSLLAQVWIAKILRPLAAIFGPYGSTHLVILAQKDDQP